MAEDDHRRPRGWASFSKTYGGSIHEDETEHFPPLGTANSNSRTLALASSGGYGEPPVPIPVEDFPDAKSSSSAGNATIAKDFPDPAARSSSIAGNVAIASSSVGDDSYQQLRKDAIRMSRAMSRHARSATGAYNRGDHHRAKQLSRQSRHERELADKLNLEAAAQIMRMRNPDETAAALPSEAIDLHGLHVREAVAVVEQRLRELEEHIAANSSSRHKTNLTIITGTGSHSRDGPAIPNAVTNFLIVNNYRYVEPRAGMISVQLKLRKQPDNQSSRLII